MSRRKHGAGDPLWYKDAIIYQVHVKAFHDSDGDGIGDLRGLTAKLDYLQDLGVTALWLLPFYPSPLRDDGYDIAGYRDVHPSYGTLDDFREFLDAAHARELRVITELVINHTSDQHPWFQRARRALPGSPERDYYVWSDDPDRYAEARIIFKDFESSNWAWDPVAEAYYWHRFYSHQPDLNFDNPKVREEVFGALDFWLDMGVDGLRLDAIPYLFEREGTNCENLPETHAFLKEIRAHVDRRHGDRMLLAEANQWPDDAVAYFGDGDECHMAFHFPVMPRLFMGIHMEDRFSIEDILLRTPPIPEGAQWAVFLRNHDELTLEMVTDEDRDYMYRVYARDPQARINLGIRRRLAPLLGNNRRKIELMNALLFSLPGTPVIYYGDEIGMGDNIFLGDRDGVRTPMQWNLDRNAGFSAANPQRLYLPVVIDPEFHAAAVNVEAQQGNPHSLLWAMKRTLGLRKRHRAFSRGAIHFLHPENRKVLVFLREWEDERILVVANLSRFVQSVELDLSGWKGTIPIEMYGHTRFPRIGDLPYFLTLGPHDYYWFQLEAPEAAAGPRARAAVPELAGAGSLREAVRGRGREALQGALPGYLPTRRWFGAKAREILAVRIGESVSLPFAGQEALLTLVEVSFRDGDPETYLLPLAVAEGEWARKVAEDQPEIVLARLAAGEEPAVLYEAIHEREFCAALLAHVLEERRAEGVEGTLFGVRDAAAPDAEEIERAAAEAGRAHFLEPLPVRAEQSNSSITFGEALILKLIRRLEHGVNPDLEISRFLTARTPFAHLPPLAGALEWRRRGDGDMTFAILQRFVPNEGDAWQWVLDGLGEWYERIVTSGEAAPPPGTPRGSSAAHPGLEIPAGVEERLARHLPAARRMGELTAELHLALGSRDDDPAFAPEPMTPMYRRSLYESLRAAARESLDLLAGARGRLPEAAAADAKAVLERREAISEGVREVLARSVGGRRIRVHGDYHLGQLLFTGRDFVLMDFEGEPARSISERRLKRSPLRDVAGMLRSFQYASFAALRNGAVRPEDAPALEPWARWWEFWTGTAFFTAYRARIAGSDLLPAEPDAQALLLRLFLLDKALYELRYELNSRPDWAGIPLRGIRELLEA
ncbi:MAG: maltose alpha-D-glucosyltransferase [Gemmatimonadota bacterium]|nr:maltose alpha-D-glucosyltransferase [Gemmatimonadota bacterium]